MLGDTLNSHKLLSATICLICFNLKLIEVIVVDISQLQKAPIWCKIALDRAPVWTTPPSPALRVHLLTKLSSLMIGLSESMEHKFNPQVASGLLPAYFERGMLQQSVVD
jgi:hypothetical protein